MRCRQCGGAVDKLSKYCPNCGRKIHKVCPACKALIDAAARYCAECGTAQTIEPDRHSSHKDSAPSQSVADDAEYRQVTVMSCDMVDSTVLSEQISAEDLRQIFMTFRSTSARTIDDFGGRIEKFSGDGVMAFFGYPVAYEDAPKRSVLAGLELLQQVRRLNVDLQKELGVSIQLRIGIHSGRVVAGDGETGLGGDEIAVIGVTPNIASRLEQLAPKDGIAVSADMKRLIDADFAFESLGPHKLKGIRRPINVFRVTKLLPADQAAAWAPVATTPLSGRDKEVKSLLKAWERTSLEREPQLAQIVGEPGIGKTALARLFLNRAAISPDQIAVLTCSAYDQDTPFGPVVRMLADELDLPSDLEPAKAQRLSGQILDDADGASRESLETLLRLLWRDPAKGLQPTLDGPAERRQLMRALIQHLRRRGRLLLLLEDAHWVDPSTRELVDRILRYASEWPVLVLVLSRPDQTFPWDKVGGVRLRLQGLSTSSCNMIVRRFTSDKPLERRLLKTLMTVTGGVPLFVEELIKSLIEGGKLIERQGRMTIAGMASDLDTPVTIQDLLTARLDAVGSAKMLAQVAAVIGRVFDLDALVQVSLMDKDFVRQDLDTLISADFLVERTAGEGTRFEFRHALYQKAAYDSLLISRQKQLHGRYLQWLESEPDRKAATPQERLAFYSEQAGFLETAIGYWIEAGEAANRASASQEAAQHFSGGLRALERLPDSEENRLLHLRLLTLLGGSLLMSQGAGAVETRNVYQRAVALSKMLPESPWHFPAYWGWWRVSENFTVMLARAQRLVAVSRGMTEPEFGLQAHHCNWANSFIMGDHETCLRHAEKGLEIYEKGQFSDLSSLYGGHDPKVCGLGESALSRWLIGQPDQALSQIEHCLSWAEKTGHLGSRLHALDIAVMLHHYRRDAAMVGVLAEQLKTIGEQSELDDYRAKGLIFEGWCFTDKGELDKGLRYLEEGFYIMQDIGTREDFPVYLSMIAECRRRLGDSRLALKTLNRGLAVMAEEGVAYWAPEIHRLYARTLMTSPSNKARTIEDHLDKAIDIARSQKALSLELRAVCTRARYLAFSKGAREEALASLKAVIGRFTEGRNTRDLREAEQQVDCLQSAGVV